VNVEILLPYWGDPELLYLAVASVQAQTVGSWRLTIVDDAYPDPAVAEHFEAETDARIRYLRHEENVGITENYRRCLELATADWIVFLGCDDVMLPNYLEVVGVIVERFEDVTFVQPGVAVIDENGAPARSTVDLVKHHLLRPRVSCATALSGERLAVSLLRGDWMYWPSIAFRRESVVETGFRDGFPVIQDFALIMDLVYHGAVLVLEPTVCFAYRRHTASASSAGALDGSRFHGERRYFQLAASQAAALGWTRASRAARVHVTSRAHALLLIPRALRRRAWEGAWRLLGHAMLPDRGRA
jgi:glycosyltransferase involved in cell wall biosynthesis